MNILMFSINPLFEDKVMGGAPKHLQAIAIHMGMLGHDVKILSTRADGSSEAFTWRENVEVLPILRFKQPFPQPYAVPAYDLAAAIQDMGHYLAWADRFYMHDGEFLFPYVYQDLPTAISLRDNVYPETLIGGFLFNADRLILISDYSKNYFLHTVGRFFPELIERITVIHNGLDWQRFKPTPPKEILNIIPVDPQRPILLHPHRPEESKGIMQTIAVVDLLIHQYGFDNLLALAPKWLDMQTTPDLKAFYDSIEHEIRQRELQDNFFFHDWIPQGLMPQYYSMGAVTLSPGYFPESFGNAVYESLGCGTPSIAARISTHRELLPDHLLDKVDYGDVEEMAAVVARIINNGERTQKETLDYLYEHYSIDRQLNAYADAILNAQVRPPMQYVHLMLDTSTLYALAPWCYVSERGIYHDYHANYITDDALSALVEQHSDGFSIEQAAVFGLDQTQIETLYRDGYLVPL